MNPFFLFGYPLALREYLENNETNKKYKIALHKNKNTNEENNNITSYNVDIAENNSSDIYKHFISSHDIRVNRLNSENEKE